jgi:hypothetical protein
VTQTTNSAGLFKHLAVAFVIALALYVIAYHAIEHRRNRNGPWRIAFTNDVAGRPALKINQPARGLTNVLLVFEGEQLSPSNTPGSFVFDTPKPVPYPVPFGRCVFMDTTFLPGTLTFQMFGHELELLPRVMILDHEERQWISGETVALPHQISLPLSK